MQFGKYDSMTNDEIVSYAKKIIKKNDKLSKKVKKLKAKLELVESKYLIRKTYCNSCDKCNIK